MDEPGEHLVPQATDAVAAMAQSREAGGTGGEPARAEEIDCGSFRIDPRVLHPAWVKTHERQRNDPIYRPLRIYSLDPDTSRLDGAVATVSVPYEPLKPGPVGSFFEVDNRDGRTGAAYRRADLDDPKVLISSGYTPSPSDPRFHQQMVYAVATVTYAAFRRALGRHLSWGFQRADGKSRLRLRPYGAYERNAYYDSVRGEICFGYFEAEEKPAGRNAPRSLVFTCLSHDIIAHEVTHALLDGLRAHFTFPTGCDVLGFHEGFADLVAFFQHFSYDKLLEAAIRKSRGRIEKATLLVGLAQQFGNTTGSGKALRSALDTFKAHAEHMAAGGDGEEPVVKYSPDLEAHDLGGVLVGAVFEAFVTVFLRKIARTIRLATGGTGNLPNGEITGDLGAALAEEASQLAGQFLNMCIRAVDYCPPVDLNLGEYLRAVITADTDLVPDDPWAYREAWIDAFRRRGIYPPYVRSLSEDALLWEGPERPLSEIKELSFAKLQFRGDPGTPADTDELVRQARHLGSVFTRPENLFHFGLSAPDDSRLDGDAIEPPRIQSIRSSRRIGPDGQINFDLIAEVTQKRIVATKDGKPSFTFFGGSTVIIGPNGEVRYVIAKSVLNRDRLEAQRAFLQGPGRRYWQQGPRGMTPLRNAFRLLHEKGSPPNGPDCSHTP